MIDSVNIFIANMETMLKRKQWSNRALSTKSGVSDRLIGMYRNSDSTPSIEKAEKIAKALGFELWQMQMPDFNPEIIETDGFARIYQAYIGTDEDGRKVMESTAAYLSSHKGEPISGSKKQKIDISHGLPSDTDKSEGKAKTKTA